MITVYFVVKILIVCVGNKLYVLHEGTLLKLSFAHENVNDFSCVYGFDVSTEEDQDSESDRRNNPIIVGQSSERFSSDSEEMSQEEENSIEPTEELISFEVNSSNLETLVGLLNPGMSKDQFLMYLVSLEFISFFAYHL